MKTNILIAIQNIINNPVVLLSDYYFGKISQNRMNSIGDALEFYIKDIFSSALDKKDESTKILEYHKFFSYLGNKGNPPDLIIRDGDAIEIKKLESESSDIALNRSYPKNKLYSDSSMITNSCKESEDGWKEKDLLYVIGSVSKLDKNRLSSLNFIYGDCYCADSSIYQRVKSSISGSISELENIELVKTNELAKIKKVDPLGITSLRVRGMWHIQNPNKVFDYIFPKNHKFMVNALITEDKYFSLPSKDRLMIETIRSPNFLIQDVQIKSPNNPAQLLECKLLTYNF